MSTILQKLACAGVLLGAAPLFAEAPAGEKCKIVVLNLVGHGLVAADEQLPAILTETLAGEVGVASGCDVVSQADIIAMLNYEKQKAVCSDGSDSCLAEVGQALGADRVVAGTLGKLGRDYILAARLMNVKKGAVEQRVEEPVSGAPEQLRRAAKNVGRRLFGLADVPRETKSDDPPPPAGESEGSALGVVGIVVASVGVVTAGVGGALAMVAESELSDPNAANKQAVRDNGLIALAVACGGVAVTLVGGILIGLEAME